MAMSVAEIRDWLSSLSDADLVGVDDGGLCLRVVGREEEVWCEIGGLPEGEPDED